MATNRSIAADDFAPALAELGLAAGDVRVVDPAPAPADGRRSPTPVPGHLLIGPVGTGLDVAAAADIYRQRWGPLLPEDGWVLLFLKDARPDAELARWRNALWPWVHVVGLYRFADGAVARETLQGRESVQGQCARAGVLLVARRREHAMSQSATVAKFDAHAAGWNGQPGRPGYAHHRWMRRYVGLFARPTPGARILDFGSGAGWVGIEAAASTPGASLRAFDPSPEMVRFATENARACGLTDFEARTGFGEDPPYPAAGEPPFDVVVSSGVVSFSPDLERWLAGLVAAVAPGGTLVVGDIHRQSRGMRRRRATRALLPAREMNALTGDELAGLLERRGFELEARAGYQLTWPVPQLAHWSDTRAGGLFSPLLLALNRAAAGRLDEERYDSWVLRLRAPG